MKSHSLLRVRVNNADAAVKSMLGCVAHIEKDTAKVCVSAINATLREVRREAVRKAQSAYTVKAGDLTRKTLLEKARLSTLTGRLSIKDHRGMNLVNFQARPNRPGPDRPKEGAAVKVLRGGSRKRPRAFGKKAFVMVGKKGQEGEMGNLIMAVRLKRGKGGLKSLYGPHPIQALSRAGYQQDIANLAEKALSNNLGEAVDKMLAASLRQIAGRR